MTYIPFTLYCVLVTQLCLTLCDPVSSPGELPSSVAHRVPLFIGFSRRGYWSGLPFPSPGDLPDLGTEPRPPALQADA